MYMYVQVPACIFRSNNYIRSVHHLLRYIAFPSCTVQLSIEASADGEGRRGQMQRRRRRGRQGKEAVEGREDRRGRGST